MKRLNYLAAIFFLLLGLTTLLAALISDEKHLIALCFICGVVSYVAWKDYKKCINEGD